MSERHRPRILRVDINPEFTLTQATTEVLERDHPLRRRLGEERFSKLNGFVIRALSGDAIPMVEITRQGIDPKQVERKAKRILMGFNSQQRESEMLTNRLSRINYSREDKLLQDPHAFLGDNSGRNNLGYIQNQPKEE